MADAMILEAPPVVDAATPADTGKPQGEKPGLPAWTAQLPKPVLEKLTAEKVPYKNLGELWTKLESLQQEVGNGVRVPGKDATQDQWASYRKAMGIPDDPQGYSLTKPNLPNGVPYSDKLEKWFRQEFFKAGIPDALAKEMFNDWNKLQIDSFAQLARMREQQAITAAQEALTSLQQEYKDEYPRAMQAMSSALARFGGPKVLDIIKQARLPNGVTLDNHPEFIKMFINVGKGMDNDQMIAGEGGTPHEREPRPGIPRSPSGYPMEFYPNMEKDPRFRVKAE